MLTGTVSLLCREDTRRDLAAATGVVVGPEDANPWGLPVSGHKEDWGVRVGRARGSLGPISTILGRGSEFILEIVELNTISYRMYEDSVIELSRAGGIVGISFDYPELTGRAVSEMNGARPGRHVARLSPAPDEMEQEPHILSSYFKFDYSGQLHLFDDSGEMGDSGCLVSWARLVEASWAVDGGFWSVRQAVRKRDPQAVPAGAPS
jgi:hypothetical protein